MQFKITWPQIIILCAAVLLTFLFTNAHVRNKASERYITTLQSQLEQERAARVEVTRLLDTVIATHTTSANQSITKARSNATYYQTIPKRLETIRANVSVLSDSALRRAFAEFR